eukprot:SAG31_NODE_601_length_13643_cov_64.237005_2_plen_107_part_00
MAVVWLRTYRNVEVGEMVPYIRDGNAAGPSTTARSDALPGIGMRGPEFRTGTPEVLEIKGNLVFQIAVREIMAPGKCRVGRRRRRRIGGSSSSSSSSNFASILNLN